MTDKEKIREEFKRLREQLQNKVEESDFISGEVFIINYFLTFIDSLKEEPNAKFKVGQTITDPTDSTFIFHINKIENGRYIEKEDEWVHCRKVKRLKMKGGGFFVPPFVYGSLTA